MTRGVTYGPVCPIRSTTSRLGVCIGIGILVFGAMFIAMFRFRKSQGAVAEQWSPQHQARDDLDGRAGADPGRAGVAWPATKLWSTWADTKTLDMTIKVTGYQWKWRYEYVDYRARRTQASASCPSSTASRTAPASSARAWIRTRSRTATTRAICSNVDKPLVVPVDTKIRFVITGDDVIHAWWVPALGWKQDAIPGIINGAWTNIPTPGIYRGQCAELCGQDHGFMPIVVKAVPKAEFAKWLAAAGSSAAPPQRASKAAATADRAGTRRVPPAPPQG